LLLIVIYCGQINDDDDDDDDDDDVVSSPVVLLCDLSYNHRDYVLTLSYDNPTIKSYRKMIVRYFANRAVVDKLAVSVPTSLLHNLCHDWIS